MFTWTKPGSHGGFSAEIQHRLIYEKLILAVVLKKPVSGANREGRRLPVQEKIIVGWTWLLVAGVLRSGSSQSGWILKVEPTGFPDRLDVI